MDSISKSSHLQKNQIIQLLKTGEQMKNSPYANMKQILLMIAVSVLVAIQVMKQTILRMNVVFVMEIIAHVINLLQHLNLLILMKLLKK